MFFKFYAGYQKKFTWDTYLVDVSNIPAPYELFTSVCFIYFVKGSSQMCIYYHITNVQIFVGLT